MNDRVQQYGPASTSFAYQRTYGVTGVPYLTDGSHYNQPSGVAVASDGSIYLTENMGQRLDKLNASGALLWSVGAPGVKGNMLGANNGNNFLSNPADVALDSAGHVYVADQYYGRVQIYNSNGTYYATIPNLNCPGGVGFAPNGVGDLYVADSCNNTVDVFDTTSSHNLVATLGVPLVAGSDNAHFNWPQDVAVDGNGLIYVADQNNDRVQVFDASRNYLRTIGVTGSVGNDFGLFHNPTGLAVDSSNRVYVGDSWNDRVQVFDSSGAYLTTIGGWWGSGTDEFRSVGGIALDSAGNVYVADNGENHRVEKFSLGTPGWTQSNINGFGDIANGDTGQEGLNTFNSQLYAGTYTDGSISAEVGEPAMDKVGISSLLVGPQPMME